MSRSTYSSIYILLVIPCRKYEEICAPRVEEFCFITDNTYKKEEVRLFLIEMTISIIHMASFTLINH